jgi:hypothetical protein
MATRRRHGERGQTTPFFLCFLVVMTMFVGLIVNVGQAVNRRMALQITADAGAWTGATNMAIGMNALAEINQWRRNIHPLIDPGLYIAGALSLDGVVKAIWEFATAVLDTLDAGVQIGYAKIPYDEAARVTWYNNQDLFPGEQLQWYEGFRPGWFSSGSDTISNEVPFGKSRPTFCMEQPFPYTKLPLPCLVDLDPINTSITYFTPRFPPFSCCPVETYSYTKWWEKTGLEILFVWIVEAPPTRPHYNPFGLFGDDAIPMMRAAAAAKPVGGTIESGDDEYRAKFVPLTQASMLLQVENILRQAVYDPTVDKWRPIAY